MSWTVSFSNKTASEFNDLDINDAQLQNGLGREPFTEARRVLAELVYSGVLGNLDGHFSGYLAGHANENHEPLPGWPPDTVTISVSKVREPSALDKAANAGN